MQSPQNQVSAVISFNTEPANHVFLSANKNSQACLDRVTDSRVVRAGVSVTQNVLL